MIKKALTLAALTAVLALTLCASAVAADPFEVAEFGGVVTNQSGETEAQAGAHPYAATTQFKFNIDDALDQDPKNVIVELPPGLIGNPNAVGKCPQAEFNASNGGDTRPCPDSTAIGVATVEIVTAFGPFAMPFPIYNLEPAPGVPASFAFNVIGNPVYLNASVRTNGDYGVTISTDGLSQGITLGGTKITLWGVPSDPSHDAERGGCLLFLPGPCRGDGSGRVFLTNPTNCAAGPRTTAFRADTWQMPGDFRTASFNEDLNGNPTAVENCEAVPFGPKMEAVPHSTSAESPTGLDVELSFPDDTTSTLGQAALKKAVVKLPAGMAISPAAADGLGGCGPAQLALEKAGQAGCPESSKIGTVTIRTQVLDVPMTGELFLAKSDDKGTPQPGAENPFDSLLSLYLVAGARGVTIALPGSVGLDPSSGQITTTFDDNPELPFETMNLRFKGGPRAALVTPPSCGTYTTVAEMTPWSAANPDNPTPAETVVSKSSFSVTSGPGGGPCPNGSFAPKLDAGTTNPVGGAFSPFVLGLTREDGTRTLSAVDVTLPPGLLSKLAGMPYCPDAALAAIPAAAGTAAAEIASPSCPAASQIGSVRVAAGAGSNPYHVAGWAYLAGPYKGAPLSLAVVTPALAGPLDLGNVVVRSALHVDPWTTQVRAVSDPLPTILAGIPLNLRDVRVNLYRPGFTLNPTSCDPMSIDGQVVGAGGVVANVSQRFQAASCAGLGFKPRLSLRLKGKTHRSAHPALKAVLTPRKGNANIGKAVVTLPKTQFLEQDHIRTICTRVQYAEGNCPKASIYGYAKAWTPLLDKPLQGPVYLRSSNNELPDLVADLNGQIEIDLAGRIDSVNSRMRTTFWAVPDAPVSRFVLRMQGGKKGLLVNNTELCKAKPRAKAAFTGHNGKRSVTNPLVKVNCGKGNKRQQKRR